MVYSGIVVAIDPGSEGQNQGNLYRITNVLTILIKLLHDGDIMFELEIVISEGDGSDSRVVLELTGVWIS